MNLLLKKMSTGESAAILVKTLEFKDDIPKFVQYIRDNIKHFPFVKEEELVNIVKEWEVKQKLEH